VRTESGEAQLEPRFVPPVLDLAASRHLLTIARGIVEILSARSSSLSATRKQRNRALAHFDASDLAAFWLLYTVNTHLPVVRHIFEGRRAHPEALYEALLALASALTSFSGEMHPRDLPAYDHGDLRGCFERLDAIIRELLETVVPRNYAVLALTRTDSFIHAVAIDDDRLFAGTQMYLGVKTAAGAEEVARRGPLLLKVGAAPEVERLIRHALPGLGTRYVPVAPGNVPVKLGYHYFELDRSGGEWDAVRSARNLAVYVPSDFPEPQLELVVMLPTAAAPAGSGRR
jgi:type VI secretion system protein ImpJ